MRFGESDRAGHHPRTPVSLYAYLVEGKSVRDLALESGESEAAVRAALSSLGIRIEPGSIRDPVCAAVAWRGYISFSEFARRHGLEPLADQAVLLGVQRSALEKLHDQLRKLAEAGGGA